MSDRRIAVVCSGLVVAVGGLGIHASTTGTVGGLVADSLYTVLVYLVLAFVLPAADARTVGAAAFSLSAAVEMAQLTGGPEALSRVWPPFGLLFGSTFQLGDLVAYAAGAVAVTLIDRAARRNFRRIGEAGAHQGDYD